MPKKQRFIKQSSRFYRALVATALLSNGVFQFVAPVLAEGTAAGQTISNTATATYDNPDDPTTPLNATSNTVTVTVAEVAGVTVTDNAPTFKTDANGDGDYNTNDIIYFNFSVKNTGNDPTKFVIPESPLVTDNNSGVTLGQLDGKVQINYGDANGWNDLPSGGVTNSVASDATISVRVPVKILNNGDPTNGDQISVQLGDTTNNAQNIARTTNDATDLYTQDNTGTDNGDASANPPVNGVREASDTSTLTLTLKALLNGPQGTPAADYNGDNNQDFTNKSSAINPGTAPGSLIDPNAVTFNNTIQNTGTGTNNISLLPTPPTNIADLPNNTVVTISANNGNTTATYTYNSTTGVFTFTSGTGVVGGNPVSATNPVRIDNVAAGDTAPYTVEVNLPANTPLSTDIEKGFPVPVTAFVDLNSNAVIDTSEPRNITIDRVYTGFLKLVKKSRILKGTGPDVGAGQENFESTPAVDPDGTGPLPATDPNPGVNDVPRTPAPGNIIEYQITSKNISEAQSGTGNKILQAANVQIIEDGTTGGNNWALDNNTNSEIDTSHVTADSGGEEIVYYNNIPPAIGTAQSGTTAATNVTKYVVKVTSGNVTPQSTVTFTFQRKISGTTATP
ncbi:hypothetical protein H6G41_20470 [Tolypothrix sp. FACHB-123]|uniref:hypothetical protein n=1 Tax=Tolypothrix sp. FACHB-123 TaxID=2692868 RepID=UPI001685C5A7|nr:hypothetical protein [Tolypothrix sp. FACHB-123]MBD2356971.1 hypothetical protein [Tolypothrix sp. FACHB-123]